MGFHVHCRGTFHDLVFEKLDPSDPDCKGSWVDVEEWIDADERL
jgi:hypothetical protein